MRTACVVHSFLALLWVAHPRDTHDANRYAAIFTPYEHPLYIYYTNTHLKNTSKHPIYTPYTPYNSVVQILSSLVYVRNWHGFGTGRLGTRGRAGASGLLSSPEMRLRRFLQVRDTRVPIYNI